MLRERQATLRKSGAADRGEPVRGRGDGHPFCYPLLLDWKLADHRAMTVFGKIWATEEGPG